MRAALAAVLLLAGATVAPAFAQTPPVPGGCAEPAEEHRGEAGCYLAAELRIASAPADVFWHILRFRSENAARAEAARHEWSVVTGSHGYVWLHVLADREERFRRGRRLARVGPLRLTEGAAHRVRFIESVFPPGMRTRSHTHPGPEGFYVLDGVQCMETPTQRARVRAGRTFVVEPGAVHVQSAPDGRRNVGVVIHEEGAPWMTITSGWTPTNFCEDVAK